MADDPVAGDDDGDGVLLYRLTDGTSRLGASGASGDVEIASRFAVGYAAKLSQYSLREFRQVRYVDLHIMEIHPLSF